MAIPTNAVYAKSSVPIYGGRSGIPSYIEAIGSDEWATVPLSTTLADLDPSQNPAQNPNYPGFPEYGGIGPFSQIITAWCSAAADLEKSRIRFALQGGHADWCGNDGYDYLLDTEDPRAIQLQPPSGYDGTVITNDGQEATGLYSDGRPRAIHSYNKHVWAPGEGFVTSIQGGTSWSGQAGTNNAIFWNDDGSVNQFGPLNPYVLNGATSGSGACYDSTRHCIWWHGRTGGAFSKLDLATRTWSNPNGNSTNSDGDTALAYSPDGDYIVWFCNFFANGFSVYNPATGGTVSQPSLNGSIVGSVLDGKCQPVYVDGRFYWWNNPTDTAVINYIEPTGDPYTDPWKAGQLPVSVSNAVTPSDKVANGTYGRFGWLPKLGVFYVINDLYNVYVFKPGNI